MMISKKRVCECGAKGVIWHNGKWWCGFLQGFGICNVKGKCKEEDNDTSSSRRGNNDSE